MGTWDFGPFDNDDAADFADRLDTAGLAERADLVRAALRAVLAEAGYLEVDLGAAGVAAAALVAARCPGGEPVNPVYGPKGEIPGLGGDLVDLAVRALDRIGGADSELAELWAESGEGERWAERIAGLRVVLVKER
ncbi:DUF4259 domain-containing protein [Kitasatospora viridis]|uniref:Uncharacterized protein DUF4259 n=1 Tax=Kitasatospora viridis TaxID=281105 RepID=A0A561UPJ5_9ACTN|nr:DUF4259 domain-containing protein [Kitasatospora viridis]TWG01270.1 uncharacterized protein DUF4259 [Kitasatospora viridis]